MKAANMTFENEVTGHSAEPMAYLKQILTALRQTLRTWRQRAETRRALGALTPRMLEDIGIERYQAEREAAMPFWRK